MLEVNYGRRLSRQWGRIKKLWEWIKFTFSGSGQLQDFLHIVLRHGVELGPDHARYSLIIIRDIINIVGGETVTVKFTACGGYFIVNIIREHKQVNNNHKQEASHLINHPTEDISQ